jgi:hypothetical protein
MNLTIPLVDAGNSILPIWFNNIRKYNENSIMFNLNQIFFVFF